MNQQSILKGLANRISDYGLYSMMNSFYVTKGNEAGSVVCVSDDMIVLSYAEMTEYIALTKLDIVRALLNNYGNMSIYTKDDGHTDIRVNFRENSNPIGRII